MNIQIKSGVVTVPENITVINLAQEGEGNFVGVLSDKQMEVERLVIVAPSRPRSAAEEDALVDKAIADFPQHQAVKAQELPYPSSDADEQQWTDWSESFRLVLYPIEWVVSWDEQYKFVRC